MKRIFIVSVFILSAIPLKAGIVVDVNGPAFPSFFVDAVFAVGWTQTQVHENLTITADLVNVPLPGVPVTAWITTAIGPSATVADQIATAPVKSSTLFSGLTLGPGSYFLIVMIPTLDIPGAGWRSTSPGAFTSAPDVTVGNSYISSPVFPDFGPSAEMITRDLQLRYTITAADAPEPRSVVLFGCGLAVLGSVFLRRRLAGVWAPRLHRVGDRERSASRLQSGSDMMLSREAPSPGSCIRDHSVCR